MIYLITIVKMRNISMLKCTPERRRRRDSAVFILNSFLLSTDTISLPSDINCHLLMYSRQM